MTIDHKAEKMVSSTNVELTKMVVDILLLIILFCDGWSCVFVWQQIIRKATVCNVVDIYRGTNERKSCLKTKYDGSKDFSKVIS